MSLPQDVITYGTLSIASYADSGVVPPGWEIVPNGQRSDPVSGFAATAFRNPLTGEIVVAFRGTDGVNDLTESGLALLLQNKPGTFDKARAFFTDIRNQFTNSPISVTGYSLGGAFAQLIGALEKVPAFAFNAPGVLTILQKIAPQEFGNATAGQFTNITNLNNLADAVSSRGVQLGQVLNLDSSSLESLQLLVGAAALVTGNVALAALVLGDAALDQHYIDNLLNKLATPQDTGLTGVSIAILFKPPCHDAHALN